MTNSTKDADLHRLASELEQHLTVIRQQIRKPVEAEFAKGGLTGPQRNVMHFLVQSNGLSLKDLTRHVGLAHSTVSGIVDRLQNRELVRRRPNPKDRRHSIISVASEVRNFMKQRYPVLAAEPLFHALRKAAPEKRTVILQGIRTLRRLLTD